MKQLSLFLQILFILITVWGCSKKQDARPPVNDYVAEYTTGIISRRTAVEVVLNDPLSNEQQDPEFLKTAFSISPQASGKVEVIDDKKLVFQPNPMLKPGTQYTITWNIGKFFKTEEKNRKFTFSFETISPEIGFRLNELDIDNQSLPDTLYEFKGSLLLSDWADSTTIHNLIGFDVPVKIKWEKIDVAKTFDFTFQTREPFEKAKEIELFTKKNDFGYPRKILSKIKIPGKHDFDVYSIRSVNDNDNFIEVIFTRVLNQLQDFTGLVEVEPENDVSFSVEGNKLKIWLQDKNIHEREVVIYDGIRSLSNRVFKRDAAHASLYKKEISFRSNYPSLEFIGEGGILPTENSMIVPFAATNLRGVIVRIIKVYENNMGQFLQENQLSEGNALASMGELLCRKLIFLDEESNYDLHKRNTFAINLKKLITPEPGALYRVILSFNSELSAYPCPGMAKMTKRELIEENRKLESEEKANFGNGNAYYYFSDQSWDNYNWQERNMPCKDSYYVNKQISKNILYSNLGIIAKRGDRGKMFVSINNITTGMPEEEVLVKVYTYQNQEISQKTTWENGTVEFDLNGKEPFYLIAKKEKQKGYLRLAKNEALSMSAFDVAGEEVKNGTKGFIYTERGIWRPGDTIYVSFILNNIYGDLPERHPVTFELFNPAGQLYWKKSLSTRNDNFYVFKPVTSSAAPTGIWKGKITVGGVSFEKKLRIETIKPNRLSIDLSFDRDILQRDTLTKATLKAQWLTGAIANSLNYDIYTTFVAMETSFHGYQEYIFDDPTRKFTANDILFSKGKLNKEGVAKIDTKMVQGGFAPGFLRAQFLTKVYEESGEFSINATQKVYSPFKAYVGILSPQKGYEPLTTNKNHVFSFATLLPDGTPASKSRVKIQLYKMEWYWWWNSDMSQVANYISSGYNKPIKQFEQQSNQDGKGQFSLKIPNMDWGTYYIQLTDLESGHQCGCMAYFDSYGDDARSRMASDKAMLLSLQADKKSYAPGEEITIRFPSTAESRAIITVEASGGIMQHHEMGCNDKESSFSFKASPEMQPNVYVSVTLLNPYASTKYDLPIRLYGVIPIEVHAVNSRLLPVIEASETIRPSSSCKISVSESNGQPMTFTLGVVDEGLLDLTNFKTPSPWDAFFAKEALGMRTWDMYNYVLGAYGGKIEQIFSIGGDDALNKGPKAIVNRFKPVVRFMGPYTLKPNEKRTLTVNIPEYIGKVRCMVIAGNQHQYGNAQKDIFVRQPLMILGTLPRKLAPNDEIWLPATVFAMKDNIGPVTVNLEVNEAFEILEKRSQGISFSKIGNQVVWFKIRAKKLLETGKIRLTVTGKGEKASWSSDIEINSPLTPIYKTNNWILDPGESKKFEITPFGIPGSNKSHITVAGIKQINLNNRLNYLITYPYECLEQIISKAFGALYLPQITQFSPKELEKMEEVVRSVNSKLKNYMIPGGGFSFWPGGSSTNAWTSIYAFLYLNKAADSGFILTSGLRHECGQYQSRLAREWKPVESPNLVLQQVIQAFRLYALADAHIPEKGAMNRLRQTKNLSLEATWLLAAAYSFDNKEIARQILESIESSDTMLKMNESTSLFLETTQLSSFIGVGYNKQAYALVQSLLNQLQTSEELNTAAIALSIINICNYYKQYPEIKTLDFDISKNGKIESVHSEKTIWTNEISLEKNTSEKIQITNKSKGTLYIQDVISGIPTQGEQIETSNGIQLKTKFKSLTGNIINPQKIEQGTNFIFEISVINKAGIVLHDMMVDQMIPAGWEILNRGVFTENNQYPIGVTYQDIRDDKVSSYINRLPTEQTVTIPIYVTAAYAGTFFMPSSTCRAMYQTNYNASSKSEEVMVVRE
ncbi:MAG: MG2 domain-containing protein [Bacteroidales bacterium]